MRAVPIENARTAARVGGWSLVLAALGFVAVFAYLAARFDYPDVLDGTAADVLPRLLALGESGRAVWVVYAFLPLLLIPAGVGARFEVSTFSGNIRNGLGPAAQRVSRYGPGQELSFSSGNGGALVRVKSFSGSVTLGSD